MPKLIRKLVRWLLDDNRSQRRGARQQDRRQGLERLEARAMLAANLVRDFNTSTALWNSMDDSVEMGGVAYFVASTGGFGAELWRSGGTESTTKMVKDIRPGALSGFAPKRIGDDRIVVMGGQLYFIADDGVHGTGLWKSDGTEAGTELVKELNAGDRSGGKLTRVANRLYFLVGGFGQSELWTSDGTEAGTTLLKSAELMNEVQFTQVGERLYFGVLDTATASPELWSSDGSIAGTNMVRRWPAFSGVALSEFTEFGGTLYFVATNSEAKKELWKSDGTPDGTVNIAVLGPNTEKAHLTNVNGSLFFQAFDAVHGGELWKSDGNSSGTLMVKDIQPGLGSSKVKYLANMNGKLFFAADDGVHGSEPWVSDGTTTGTVLLKDVNGGSLNANPHSFSNVNGTIYFRARTATEGVEIWKTNGTAAGTELFRDLRNGVLSSQSADPRTGGNLANVNGTLFFRGFDNSGGYNLWASGGTVSTTVMVSRAMQTGTRSSYPTILAGLNESLVFTVSSEDFSRKLLAARRTSAGSFLVEGLVGSRPIQSVRDSLQVGGALYMLGTDAEGKQGLWRTQGTSASTIFLKEFTGSFFGGTRMFNVNDQVYVWLGSTGELWTSDGTSNGTRLVSETLTGQSLDQFTNVNGVLYFVDSRTFPAKLWKIDGTDMRSVQLEPNTQARGLVNLNGVLYFQLHGSSFGADLWRSDGTSAGTVRITNLGPGFENISEFTVAGNNLFYTALTSTEGRELYKSDGTVNGTGRVRDIFPGARGANPSDLVNLDGSLYFTANDGVHGIELWKSDGTESGTAMVRDIWSGAGSGVVTRTLKNLGGILYFAATDGVQGDELWKSDGTASGTTMLASIFPGSGGSWPSAFAQVKNRLYFEAQSPEVGRELWSIDVNRAPTGMVLSNATIAENAGSNGVIGSLSMLDPDRLDTHTFVLPTGVGDNALFNISGSTLRAKSSLNFESRSTYSVTVRGTDVGGIALERTFAIKVTNVNEAPVLDPSPAHVLTTIQEDVTNDRGTTILSLLTGVTDVDAGALRGIALTQTSGTTTGKWQYSLNSGSTWLDVGTVSSSSALLLPSATAKIRYVPNLDFYGTVQIGFRAWDQTSGVIGTKVNLSSTALVGGGTAYSLASDIAVLTVTSQNDAPVLNTALTPSLTSIHEDTANPVGDTLSGLLKGVTDVDVNALKGIAISQATGATTGVWQYSLTNGASWSPVGTVSSTQALLLPSAGSRLRYVPNANFNGTVQIAYRAWDQTSGIAGAKVNASTSGRATAYSAAIETATLTVRPVNDAPQWLRTSAIGLGTIRNTVANSTSYLIATSLLGSNATDVDSGALKGVAIFSIPSSSAATVWYQLAGTTTWTRITSASVSSAFLLPSTARLQFRPVSGFVGVAQIDFRVWDQTTGTTVGRASLASTGGTTAFSSQAGIAELRIVS